MGIREEKAKIDAEEKANRSKRRASQRKTLAGENARQKGYDTRTGSQYRTPAQQRVHLENMRAAQRAGFTPGAEGRPTPTSAGGKQGFPPNRAPTPEAPPKTPHGNINPKGTPQKPSIRERASQKTGEARDKINVKREEVRKSKGFQKVKAGAGKVADVGKRAGGATLRGGGKILAGGYRAGALGVRGGFGIIRAGLHPAALAAAAGAYGYSKGEEHTAAREQSGDLLRQQYGPAAPSRGQMQPFDAPLTEKFSTTINDVAARNQSFFDNKGAFLPDTTGMNPEEAKLALQNAYEAGPRYANSGSEDLLRADQADTQDTISQLRPLTDTAGQTGIAADDLRHIGQQIVDGGYVDALNNPNTSPEDRREIYDDITRGLASVDSPISGAALNQVLLDSGVNADFLQQVALKVDPHNVPLIGYGEGGDPESILTDDGYRLRSPIPVDPRDPSKGSYEDISGRGASTGGVRSFDGRPKSFTDLDARGTSPYTGYDFTPATEEERQGNVNMRERLFENTAPLITEEGLARSDAGNIRANLAELDRLQADGKIKIIGGRSAAYQYAAKLDTPEGRAQLDLDVKLKKMSDNKLPAMSGAELAALPARERLGAIQDRRDQAQADIAERMSGRRWQQEIDELADPGRTLRKAARTNQTSAKNLQIAREKAEETLRTRVESEYGLDISTALESTGIERQETDAYVVGRASRNAALREFDEQIRGRAGDNVAAGRAITTMSRQSGISELVANQQLSSSEAEYQVANLYALDKMLKTFSRKTGKTVGVNVVQTFKAGGMPAIQDLFRSQFVEGGGEFHFDDPSLKGILDGSEFGAVVDRMQSAVTGGLFGDSGVGTMMLRGPEGERISVEELFGGDPFMYETFINMIQDAQDSE